MNQSLLSFYAHSPPAVSALTGEGTVPSQPAQVKAPVQHHPTPCSYGVEIGCKRAFRSKACCEAVQDHDCDPPKELLPSFVKGKGPITLAQVYVAHGYHR